MTRLTHLADEISAGAEIYFTGKSGGQYLKTAFILCDDYSELGAKLYLLEQDSKWADEVDGRFKSFWKIMEEVEAACPGVAALCREMKERRQHRNKFFHSAALLDLNMTSRMCVEAYCDLFEYCQLLFGERWTAAASGARNLDTFVTLFRLERHAFSDPNIQGQVNDVLEKVKRNRTSRRTTGVQIAFFPEDLHLRLSVISGGTGLRDELQTLLDDCA